MKKLIRSIVAFFFSKEEHQCETPTDYAVSQQREDRERMPTGTYYGVYYGEEWQSYELNLLSVSRKYSVLKKSTLYNAFKGGRTPRTYERENYTVVECQKF